MLFLRRFSVSLSQPRALVAALVLAFAAFAAFAPSLTATPVSVSALGEDAYEADVATSATGVTHLIWERYDGSNDRVQYVRTGPGGALGTVLTLSVAGQEGENSEVAARPDGGADVVWSRNDGVDAYLHHVRIDASGNAGTVNNIAGVPFGSADYPSVAVDTFGNTHIAWQGSDLANYRARYVKIDSAGTVGAVQTLSVVGANGSDAKVAVDPAGNAHVVWTRTDGAFLRVQYARIAADGTIGATQTVSPAGAAAANPRVAADSDGNAHITWERTDGSNVRAQYARVSGGTTVGAVQTLSAAGQSVNATRVAASTGGAGHVSWRRSDGSKLRVQYVRITDGVTVGAVQTPSDGATNAQNPTIFADSSGVAWVTWSQTDGSFDRIRYAKATDGVTGTVQTISRAAEHASEPEVAVDSYGDAFFAWERTTTNSLIDFERVIVAPVCTGTTIAMNSGTSTTVPLACTKNVASIATAGTPTLGTLGTVDQTAGTVSFTAKALASGSTSFTFTGTNDGGTSSAATVTINVTCKPTKLIGCSTADKLYGTAKGETMRGKAGADRIYGRGGADKLYGDTGNDQLYGEGGKDKLYGAAGRDKFFGGASNDTIYARKGGKDTVNCGLGNDLAYVDKSDTVNANCETVRVA